MSCPQMGEQGSQITGTWGYEQHSESKLIQLACRNDACFFCYHFTIAANAVDLSSFRESKKIQLVDIRRPVTDISVQC